MGVVSALLPLPLVEAEDEPLPVIATASTLSVDDLDTDERRLERGLERGLVIGLAVGLGAA
jgi:hypothetical protein